jgi:hypothetical protein
MVGAMAPLSHRIAGTFLAVLIAALVLVARMVAASDDAAPAAAGPHGWTAGTPAAGTADALSIPEPVAVTNPLFWPLLPRNPSAASPVPFVISTS